MIVTIARLSYVQFAICMSLLEVIFVKLLITDKRNYTICVSVLDISESDLYALHYALYCMLIIVMVLLVLLLSYITIIIRTYFFQHNIIRIFETVKCFVQNPLTGKD
jgi:hypothetical protein